LESENLTVPISSFAIAEGSKLGLREILDVKRIYDQNYLNKKYFHELNSLQYSFDGVFFAVAGCFTPYWDFRGKRLEDLTMEGIVPFATLDVIPQPIGKTSVLINYSKKYEVVLRPFIDGIYELFIGKAVCELVWEIALRYCENIVLAPSFWGKIDPGQKRKIEKFVARTTPANYEYFPFPYDKKIFEI
jgi:hypothetical protein